MLLYNCPKEQWTINKQRHTKGSRNGWKVEIMLEYTCGYADTKNIRAWSGLAWAEFDRSGNVVNECKNEHYLLTAEEMKEAREAIQQMHGAPYSNAYLRFNDLPEGGKSKNYATGEIEAGISCYALRWDLADQCYKRTGGGLDGAMIAYAIQGAPMYLVSGDQCGVGSDGEPVIDNVKILASLKFDAKKDGYILA